jgi:hypothetical protein
MENHPIPRQITTFEFKLIGFLTLHQFIYLCIFFPLAVIFYYLIPLPFLNILFAIFCVCIGLAIAFVPYNERSLDVWIKNFLKKLFSSSQYYYIKRNPPPAFLKDVFIYSSPKIVQTHLVASQKLSSYLSKKKPEESENNQKKQIRQLISSPPLTPPDKTVSPTAESQSKLTESLSIYLKTDASSIKKPFLFGVVKNSKNLPLSDVLVYIKNEAGQNIRILKTNAHGLFATFHPFPPNNYIFEIKDLGNKFFFDTMKIKVSAENKKPLNFVSKELL